MPYGKKIAAAVIAAAVVGGVVAPMRAEVIEQVLVKVNGEIFTKTELEARQVQALRQLGQQQDLKTSDAELRKMLDQVTPSLIVNVVDEMLMIQRGRELGYRMGDEQFQSILANIKKDNKLESDEQFAAALKQENMTMADLRKSLERQMIVSRVQQNEVLGKVSVSDDEARRYYQAHLSEFSSQQSITLREIFVAVAGDANASVADDNTARTKATDIRRRALAGESFDKLAAELSDAPSKANAGLIGPLNTNDLSPDVKALLDPMKPGDITEVLRGNKGYQLLKLESRDAPQVTPFEQAREDISNRVFTDKRREEFSKYLERARMEAIIEWKNADLKRAFEEGVVQAKAAASAPAPAPAR
jgi:peptidyl-prolyl cis-trans isomerase SurA